MSEYIAPLKDISFVLKHVVGLGAIARLPGCEEVSDDLADAILEEAGKFSGNVLSPINRSGDLEGAKWSNGVVTTPKGFKDAFKQLSEGGWIGLGAPTEYGGQGLPHVVSTAVGEFLISAAVREAEQVIERERLIRLSREDANLVVSLMTNPPKPGPALQKAAATHRRLTRGS